MIPLLVLLAATSAAPQATAVRASKPPHIDGRLDDAVWAEAPILTPFTQQQPDEGKPPSEATLVRIAYDDRAIYFSVRCEDGEGAAVVANLTRRDRDAYSDAVIIDLDTRGTQQSAFHFEVSAAGVQRDALRTGDDALNFDWDAVWQSAVVRDDHGWSAELAIPLADLRYPAAPVADWRLQIRRFIARRSETDQWVYVPRSESGELLHYAPLRGLADLPQPKRLELVPFALGRVRERSSPPELGLPHGWDASADVGLDARYGLTSALTLDATVLPDFGQVEADQVILNLTTFELEFPEKRPFFLEGADQYQLTDAFGSPLSNQLFYSRRIGAPAPSAAVPDGARLLDAPDRIRILGAVKLTGRIGERLDVAALDGLAAAEHAEVADAQGARLAEALSPLSNFAVLRLRRELFGNLTAGLTATDVARAERAGALVFAGACPDGGAPGADGRCTHDALAGGLDLAWHTDDGTWVASAALLASHLLHGPSRTLPDGTTLAAGDTGWGYRMEAAKPAGHLRLDASYEVFSPHLDFNDAGYLASQNLRHLFTRVAWREFDRGPTRDTEVGLELFGRESSDGISLARGIQLNEATTWANSWTSFVELQRYPTTYDNRETRDGAVYQRTAQLGIQWSVATNWTAPYAGELDGELQTTWKGFALNTSGSLVTRPLSRLELSVGPTLERVTGDPRWVETVGSAAGAPLYHFGLQDAAAPGATLRSTYCFSTNLTFQLYSQLFFASVRYGQMYEVRGSGARPTIRLGDLQPVQLDASPFEVREAVLNVNAVLRWEYLPGSVLYLVYTRAEDGSLAAPLDGTRPRFDLGTLARGSVENILLAKATFFWSR